MNIGIDISLLKINLAGMGIYVKEMVEFFSLLDKKNSYYLFTNSEIKCDLNIGCNFHVIKKEVNPHIVWLQLTVPKLIREYKIDVFWQPDHILPPRIPGVDYYVTIHDLSGYKLHNVALKKVEIVFKLFMKRTCQDAKKIITISQYSKKDIIETLSVDPNKIEVVYNGDSPYRGTDLTTKETIEKCFHKFNVECPYFLFVGTINPRKNVITIINAFNKFRKNNFAQLVIVGEYGWNSQNVMDAVKDSKYKDDIKITGYVSELEKEIFYRNAKCLVFPSILEGFGLPLVEAMSVGLPVIISNMTSLPEVGGDAAIYLNNYLNSTELANLMCRIIQMNENEYDEICNKSIDQSKKFSRKECAVDTLKILTNGEV